MLVNLITVFVFFCFVVLAAATLLYVMGDSRKTADKQESAKEVSIGYMIHHNLEE